MHIAAYSRTAGYSIIVAFLIATPMACAIQRDSIGRFESFTTPRYQKQAASLANRSPQWSADGQTIIVYSDHRIYQVDVHGRNLKRIPRAGTKGQYSPSVSRSGNFAYLDATDEVPQITTADINGGPIKYHAETTARDAWGIPALSPNGRYIAFSEVTDDNWEQVSKATIIDLHTATTTKHTGPARKGGKPVWSNNGEQIDFTWGHWHCYNTPCFITIMNTDGSNERIIEITPIPNLGGESPVGRARISSVAWSPDDRIIYYVAQKGTHLPTVLYSTILTTMQTQPIYDLGRLDVLDLDVSPDGSMIVFAASPPLVRDNQLYSVNTDGSNFRMIDTAGLAQDLNNNRVSASWSPDGRRIAVNSDTGLVKLFTMNPDGSEVRALIRVGAGGRLMPGNAEPLRP